MALSPLSVSRVPLREMRKPEIFTFEIGRNLESEACDSQTMQGLEDEFVSYNATESWRVQEVRNIFAAMRNAYGKCQQKALPWRYQEMKRTIEMFTAEEVSQRLLDLTVRETHQEDTRCISSLQRGDSPSAFREPDGESSPHSKHDQQIKYKSTRSSNNQLLGSTNRNGCHSATGWNRANETKDSDTVGSKNNDATELLKNFNDNLMINAQGKYKAGQRTWSLWKKMLPLKLFTSRRSDRDCAGMVLDNDNDSFKQELYKTSIPQSPVSTIDSESKKMSASSMESEDSFISSTNKGMAYSCPEIISESTPTRLPLIPKRSPSQNISQLSQNQQRFRAMIPGSPPFVSTSESSTGGLLLSTNTSIHSPSPSLPENKFCFSRCYDLIQTRVGSQRGYSSQPTTPSYECDVNTPTHFCPTSKLHFKGEKVGGKGVCSNVLHRDHVPAFEIPPRSRVSSAYHGSPRQLHRRKLANSLVNLEGNDNEISSPRKFWYGRENPKKFPSCEMLNFPKHSNHSFDNTSAQNSPSIDSHRLMSPSYSDAENGFKGIISGDRFCSRLYESDHNKPSSSYSDTALIDNLVVVLAHDKIAELKRDYEYIKGKNIRRRYKNMKDMLKTCMETFK